MNQNRLENMQGQVSQKKALGFACDKGILTGFRMGIISCLIGFLLLLLGSEKNAFSVILRGLVLLALIGGWPVIPLLCGAFVAKKTGRGAGIGAYCGLFLGPFAVLVTVLGTIIEILVCAMLVNVRVIPNLWAIAFAGGNLNGIGDLAIVLPYVVIGAFIASFVVGPLLGALGGGAYRSFADKRRGWQ